MQYTDSNNGYFPPCYYEGSESVASNRWYVSMASFVGLAKDTRDNTAAAIDSKTTTVFTCPAHSAKYPTANRRTYAEIARKIGHPSAARAVAGACAANPVAVLIPCHRVVRGDGGLGGYRWDLRRKRALLEREAAQRAEPAES